MADNGKMDWVAEAVNRAILGMLDTCRAGDKIKDRVFVGVIGYGESVRPLVGGKISDIAGSATSTKTDSEGSEMPVWVESRAGGGRPMADAFRKASDLIGGWVSAHQNSFPPIVINITGGEPDDFEPETGTAPQTEKASADLMAIRTNDGVLILVNAHVTGATSAREALLPNNSAELSDPYARLLFDLSSVIPEHLLDGHRLAGGNPGPGARWIVFNAGAATLENLLAFGRTLPMLSMLSMEYISNQMTSGVERTQ